MSAHSVSRPHERRRPSSPSGGAPDRSLPPSRRGWEDAMLERLARRRGGGEATRLVERYGRVLPIGYAETTGPAVAAIHLDALSGVERSGGEVGMSLSGGPGTNAGVLRFTLVLRGRGVTLSAFVPILESVGLTVVEEITHRFAHPDGGPLLHVQDFVVQPRATMADAERDGRRVAAAVRAIWDGAAECDSLNQLVLRAALDWRDVAVLRAYRRYRRQVGTGFTEPYLDAALIGEPTVAAALVGLFAARLHPDDGGDERAIADARQRVLDGCDAAEQLDTDRILRGYLNLVEATTRTNRWVVDADGRQRRFLALKLDSGAVAGMPRPAPHAEIFVCSPQMEGVHLRGGPMARGGVRWSERLEDYRTEILGLMRAQMVKNALIVPTGAKGGFVLKRRPADPEQVPDAVRDAYRTFVRGLLDVTDNVIDGRIVAPRRVRRGDDDDPYLVVAADRGTAALSDAANEISAEYGFWLGDAFASGGSRGYDHKALAITARGAWMAAEHHFRELGVDVATTPITVAGIGDMSGDVFGNGLLRSPAVRLIAAFDHRHVFIDPDPEPAAAFEERRRLFARGRSSWADYDPGLISPGGGVWPRDAKRVPLPPQARAALGVEAAELAMPDLVAAVLRAPVDLLYAAGIGTFVKADGERHEDADDRANDAVRVDASGIRARVVVEGGNLALTQRARVQYARRGGRINTDAIDNAAGVDTSDHEVNLKLLLALAESDGLLGPAERDDLLADVADDVTATVLRDVALQTDLLSREVAASPAPTDAYEALMTDLAEADWGPGLDRDDEALPTASQLRGRAAAGQALTRPELAVLLAHAKVGLAEQLTLAIAPGSPTWRAVLCGYYPQPVADRFCDLLHDPRLRSDLVRSIVATVVANDIVDRMGLTYAHRTARELGVTQVAVVRAYWAAREVTGADALWREVEGLDPALGAVAHELHREIHDLVDALARGYVRDAPEELDAAIEQDRRAFSVLAPVLAELDDDRRAAGERADRYQLAGVPPDLAARVASLRALTSAPDVAFVARSTGLPARHVATVFAELAHALPLERLTGAARCLEPSDPWERWQQHGLLDDLRSLRRRAARAALAMHPDEPAAHAAQAFVRRRAQAVERLSSLVALLEEERCADPAAAVAVAVRALGDIVRDGGAALDGSMRVATGSPA